MNTQVMHTTHMHAMTAGMPRDRLDQFSPDSKSIPIDSISWRNERERPLDEATVKTIYESINEHGLISPIGVVRTGTTGYYLIYGAHRLEAYKRRKAESAEDDHRWDRIPSLLYPTEMTEESAKLLELRENLERKELTQSERDLMSAKVLEILKPGKSHTGKKVTTDKKSHVTFHPPKQADVIATLKMKPGLFKKQFKAYQSDSGVTANWTKLTEPEYDGFIKWFKDRSAKAQAEEEAKADKDKGAEEEALKKAQEAARKAIYKAIDGLMISMAAYYETYADLEPYKNVMQRIDDLKVV